MSIYATWLPEVLRAAGLKVVTHDGWERRGAPNVANHPERKYPGGGFPVLSAVVWHHDASPRGDSPGVPESMIDRWEIAGAQLWVDRYGVWHVLAAGVAWHAGAVLAGMPSNWTSLGVETDHTVGEAWPPALLDSLRRGTAAILRKIARSAAAGLHFHKTICDPPGRKVDPDGLELASERRTVDALIAAPGGTTKGFLMALSDEKQELMFDRIMGGIPAGSAVGRKDANGKPARLLDTGDGGYLLAHIEDNATDPAAIAAAIPANLAAQVVAELGKIITRPEATA